MILGRGTKCFASCFGFYNSPRAVQRAVNTCRGIRSCSRQGCRGRWLRVNDRHADGARFWRTVEQASVLNSSCSMQTLQHRALTLLSWKSASRPSLTNFRVPWIISDRTLRLCLPAHCLCSSNMSTALPPGGKILTRALSTLSDKKPLTLSNREPAAQAPEVELSERLQGGGEKPEPDEKQSKATQLKKVFKEYGAVGVSFHVGISLISLGMFYIAVSSGINMTDLLCKLGFSESVVQSKMAAGTSTFVLAYAIHKLFAPIRISITLVSVPLIVRHLRKTGLFKPVPPKSG